MQHRRVLTDTSQQQLIYSKKQQQKNKTVIQHKFVEMKMLLAILMAVLPSVHSVCDWYPAALIQAPKAPFTLHWAAG